MQRFLNILIFSFLVVIAGKSVENYTQVKSPDLIQESSFFSVPQKLPINSNEIKVNSLINSEEDNDFKEIVFFISPQSITAHTHQNIYFSIPINEVIVFDVILFESDNSPPTLA